MREFEWDRVKARSNQEKHGIDFRRATEVFRDPLAMTIPDEEHSENEERWITLGKDALGRYILVVHTYRRTAGNDPLIRIISARRPNPVEIRKYEET